MTVFHSDLDNTLIYSGRHEIGEEKLPVELYEGREVSFVTRTSLSLLREIRERAVFVPTTTRTEEQYGRIDLRTGTPEYALVCNGGVLLRGGEEIPDWYDQSMELIRESRPELVRAERWMQEAPGRILEVRNIRGLFLFTKSSRPSEMAEQLKERLDPALTEVFRNGNKVYVIPGGLDKGSAVRRLRTYIKADTVLAAGDSGFDVPMLEEADRAYAPEALFGTGRMGKHVRKIGQGVFSDEMLHMVLEELST